MTKIKRHGIFVLEKIDIDNFIAVDTINCAKFMKQLDSAIKILNEDIINYSHHNQYTFLTYYLHLIDKFIKVSRPDVDYTKSLTGPIVDKFILIFEKFIEPNMHKIDMWYYGQNEEIIRIKKEQLFNKKYERLLSINDLEYINKDVYMRKNPMEFKSIYNEPYEMISEIFINIYEYFYAFKYGHYYKYAVCYKRSEYYIESIRKLLKLISNIVYCMSAKHGYKSEHKIDIDNSSFMKSFNKSIESDKDGIMVKEYIGVIIDNYKMHSLYYTELCKIVQINMIPDLANIVMEYI